MTYFKSTKQKACLSVAVMAVLGLMAVPVAADTLTVSSTTWGFYDPTRTGNYQINPYGNHPENASYYAHLAEVGVVNFPQAPGFPATYYGNGYYAATAEFAIPTLPSNAVVTSASLTITPSLAAAGDVLLTGYFAPNVADDPSRLFIGGSLWTVHLGSGPGQSLAPFSEDLTPIINIVLNEPAYGENVFGFSFRQVDDTCNTYPQTYAECTVVVGDSDKTTVVDFPVPVLTINYDIPATPPVAATPLPESWAMMGGGLALVGLARRWRRERPKAEG